MTTLEKIFKKIDEIYIEIYEGEVGCNIYETATECQDCIECFRNRCKQIVKECLSDDNDGRIPCSERIVLKDKHTGKEYR